MTTAPYPAYRDSGIDLIGAVPTHWEVTPFKIHVDCNDGGVWGADPDGLTDTIVLRSTDQTVDGHWRIEDPAPRQLTTAEIEASRLIEGDLLITKSSGSSLHIGKTTLVDRRIASLNFCYSNFMQRIRLKNSLIPKLAWYMLNNETARLQFSLLSNSTTGLANLNGTIIGKIIIAVPPVAEQRAIVTFLDQEATNIDALIVEQERLIALLREKRQAVISQAVTKGLDPTAPMKDSGVEWLGEVPAHWSVKRIKDVARLESGHTPSKQVPEYWEGGNIEWASLNDSKHLAIHDFISTTKFKITTAGLANSSARLLPPGSVIFTRDATIGLAAITTQEMAVSQHLIAWCPSRSISSLFLLRILNAMKRFLDGCTAGATIKTIGMPEIRKLVTPVPPIAEQEMIVSFIAVETTKLDLLTHEAERTIALLRERRAALISVAVTGKIDVRSLVPSQQEAA